MRIAAPPTLSASPARHVSEARSIQCRSSSNSTSGWRRVARLQAGRALAEAAPELEQQPRLAEPRLRHHAGHAALPALGRLEQLLERGGLPLAADEARAHAPAGVLERRRGPGAAEQPIDRG